MIKSSTGRALTCLMTAALALLLAFGGEARTGEKKDITIGIAMPTKEQPIWAAYGTQLKSYLEGAGYQTILEYAEDVTERQIAQLENMIMQDAKHLIIAPVDTFSLTDVCETARSLGVSVLSCDRLIMNTEAVDYYVTFDLIRMGEIQGEAIEKGLDLKNAAGPFTLEIFSGSPDDSNSVPFYEGAMNILQKYIDGGKLVVRSGQKDLAVNGILKWDSATAQSRMDNILGAYYTDVRLDSVLAAADCLSIGVIASLDSFGYGRSADMPFPVVTGQDCEIAAVKSIMNDQLAMSVFLDPKILAEKMLEVVDAIVEGKPVKVDRTFNNNVFEVPTILYEPLVIDKSNYQILIDRGFYTPADIGL